MAVRPTLTAAYPEALGAHEPRAPNQDSTHTVRVSMALKASSVCC